MTISSSHLKADRLLILAVSKFNKNIDRFIKVSISCCVKKNDEELIIRATYANLADISIHYKYPTKNNLLCLPQYHVTLSKR